MYVDSIDESITPHLAINGYWESWVTIALGKLVKPGMKCIDIGANVGYYTILMADLVGKEGQVFFVEPCKRSYELLLKNCNINGLEKKCVADFIAGSEEDTEKVLYYNRNMLGNASVQRPTSGWNNEDIIEQWRVDEIYAEESVFDLIRVDAEGMDLQAILGCERTLKDSTIIAFEWCQERFGHMYSTFFKDSDTDLRAILDNKWVMDEPILYYIDYDGYIKQINYQNVLKEPARLWNLVLTSQELKHG